MLTKSRKHVKRDMVTKSALHASIQTQGTKPIMIPRVESIFSFVAVVHTML
jgi:hypothetical protein